MAVEQQILDLSFKNTSGGTIPQFSVVHYDLTNAFGAVPPGNANAGPVVGINQSRDVDPTTGALTSSVQANSGMQVRVLGVSRVIVSAATVIGVPLYVSGSNGQVSNAAGAFPGGGMIGFGQEAGTTGGDIVSVYLAPSLQPALKKLTGSITASQVSVAHGLGYTPTVALIKPKANATFWESAAADATNVYITSSSAGPNACDVFVA